MVAEPFSFSEPVQRAMAQRDPVATGMELLAMDKGFRALWVDDLKRPYGILTPGGVTDATSDPRILQEWDYLVPGSSLAIVLPGRFACIDRDDVNVAVDGIPGGTWGEATHRGEHRLVMLPTPLAAKCKLPGGAGDFLAGSSSYVVFAPSRDRWPFHMAAPVLPLDPESPLWRAVSGTVNQRRQRLAKDCTPVHEPATAQNTDIQSLLKQLTSGRYQETVNLIIQGRWSERYPSRSEADFALAFMASHFTHDRDLVEALLRMYSDKARDRRKPGAYIAHTTAKAFDSREHAKRKRVEGLRSTLCFEDGTPRGVYGVTPRSALPPLRKAILLFAESPAVGEYSRGEGWRRLPVEDFAAVFDKHRQTVWRHVRALADAGEIECECVLMKSDKGPRTDTLIRPKRSHDRPGNGIRSLPQQEMIRQR